MVHKRLARSVILAELRVPTQGEVTRHAAIAKACQGRRPVELSAPGLECPVEQHGQIPWRLVVKSEQAVNHAHRPVIERGGVQLVGGAQIAQHVSTCLGNGLEHGFDLLVIRRWVAQLQEVAHVMEGGHGQPVVDESLVVAVEQFLHRGHGAVEIGAQQVDQQHMRHVLAIAVPAVVAVLVPRKRAYQVGNPCSTATRLPKPLHGLSGSRVRHTPARGSVRDRKPDLLLHVFRANDVLIALELVPQDEVGTEDAPLPVLRPEDELIHTHRTLCQSALRRLPVCNRLKCIGCRRHNCQPPPPASSPTADGMVGLCRALSASSQGAYGAGGEHGPELGGHGSAPSRELWPNASCDGVCSVSSAPSGAYTPKPCC